MKESGCVDIPIRGLQQYTRRFSVVLKKIPVMELVLNIGWLIRLHGSKHPYSYLRNHGYTVQETRSLLSGNTKRVSLSMLERLMETFSCKLDDLYDWKGDPKHRLAYLKKPELPEIEKLLEGKSPDEILRWLKGLRD